MSDTSYYGMYDPLAVPAPQDEVPATRITVHPEDANSLNPPAQESSGMGRAVNRLLGINGEERYQTWPERTVRSALTLPHDVMTGKVDPTLRRREDYTDVPYEPRDEDRTWLGRRLGVDPVAPAPTDEYLGRVQDMAGLAMSGGLAGTAEGGMVAGSGPVRTSTMRNSEIPTATAREQQQLRQAVRESGDDRSFDKHPRQEVPIKDLVATQDEVNPEIVQQKIQGGEYKGDNDAFAVLHDGKYYIEDGHHTVEAARRMGRDTVPMHVQVLSAKNEAAAPLSALEKGPIWHSPVENALEQSTTGSAPGKQWLATLQNARGVKPEELEWTGLRDFLTEHADDKVTRQELHEHMARNRVELKDVEKVAGSRKLEDLSPAERRNLTDDWREFNGHDDNVMPHHRDLQRHLNLMDEEVPEGLGLTKYHDYQLPGGENYREHLLTLPDRSGEGVSAYYQRKYPDATKSFYDLPPDQQSAVEHNYTSERAGQGQAYKSSHWDEPNIVAHVRTNDRMMEDPAFRVVNRRSNNTSEAFKTREEAEAYQAGLPEAVRGQTEITDKAIKPVKTLHIEEVQSDWHQAGRKSGYKTGERPATEQEIKQGVARTNEQGDPVVGGHGVPDAPFKDTTAWASLALKRMVRRAAEEGYDRISWTPGEAQAARYDLSKQLENLSVARAKDGTYSIVGQKKGYDADHNFGFDIPEEKLPDYVGKEMARKIVENKEPMQDYKNPDLRVGGEGMREFYDKMLPRVAEKIGKAHGVKVQRGVVETGDPHGSGAPPYENTKHQVHYFDIPPSLRDQALQRGMPLFSGGKMFIPATQPQKKDDDK